VPDDGTALFAGAGDVSEQRRAKGRQTEKASVLRVVAGEGRAETTACARDDD
jgi:hypothetical protein